MENNGYDVIEALRRWEVAGGIWSVVARSEGSVAVGLYRCDGGEEMDRLVTDDPVAVRYIEEAGRERDRDPDGRARQARPRDKLGRPLPYGSVGVEPVSEEPLPPLETITAARALLADGRPFSAHEIFETRWKSCPEAERDLWQGLAQLCVGITHAERGNATGARRLLERAERRIGHYSTGGGPSYGLELATILDWIAARLLAPTSEGWLADHPL